MVRAALRGLAAGLLLQAGLLPGQVSAQEYALSIRPAWQGLVKPGVPTEVTVRLVAAHGGTARITLTGSEASATAEITMDAGQEIVRHLPLAHSELDQAVAELRVDDRIAARETLALELVPPSRSLLAVVGADGVTDRVADSLAAGARVIHIDPGDLPVFGRSYEALHALLLDDIALAALAESQRAALAEYAGSCGRIYLRRMTAGDIAALRAVAGCGSSNLSVLPTAASVVSAPTGSIASLPATATLAPLLPAGTDPVLRSLLALLFGYCLVMGVALCMARTPATLLCIPLLFSLVAAAGWSLARPGTRMVVWAEMTAGDPVARFSAELQVTGTSPRQTVLQLPAELGFPTFLHRDPVPEVEIEGPAQPLLLHLDTHLMSQHSFRFTGTLSLAALTLDHTGSGLVVTNMGSSDSRAAVLAWRGHRYAVPVLATGERWVRPDETESWHQTPQELLLRQLAADGHGWLLQPFNFPLSGSLTDRESTAGWLLVRARSGA